MPSSHARFGLASALLLTLAVPAAAQQARQTPESQRAQQAYESQRQSYEASRDQYDARRETYNDAREEYQEARRDYDRRLSDWDRSRAAYDARFGTGAYARYYARPDWNEGYWASNNAGGREPGDQVRADFAEARRDHDRRMVDWERARANYDRRYGAGAYERNYARPVWNEAYWSSGDRYTSASPGTASLCNNNSPVAGGVIGAIAGAVLGSNVAARNARTEGAVLGGVLGAALGAGVGNANDKYKCDQRGPYFAYNETRPYREGSNQYASSFDRSYYTRNRCRLAAAPVDRYGRDVRYVRVCPDETGRYRITG
ncbi:glycine zipper 2TM domain-containing protein [Phenylobacterium sp.]|jgi:hypothetical protein|uniref:glycine zipper 2TM domain-containing protein n=1 Tax=Phenylobacterium sp. TaxID=1871053 RepID=UPI0037CCA062